MLLLQNTRLRNHKEWRLLACGAIGCDVQVPGVVSGEGPSRGERYCTLSEDERGPNSIANSGEGEATPALTLSH